LATYGVNQAIQKDLCQKMLPGEYVTDLVGDSGNKEHTKLSALVMKELPEELITFCGSK
jgi:ABC-type phosphonate transport system ATPase subunit